MKRLAYPIDQTKIALRNIQASACLNDMEKALLSDAIDLIEKIARYPLVFKVE